MLPKLSPIKISALVNETFDFRRPFEIISKQLSVFLIPSQIRLPTTKMKMRKVKK
jgi:hypothetical protein